MDEKTNIRTLNKTPLYDFSLANGAKMVPFAGFSMPVQYEKGIIAEHNWTRQKAGLFDISHMGIVKLTGANIPKGLEAICPVDMQKMPAGRQKYSYFLTEAGTIIDDVMISNYGDFYIMVVNASRKSVDVSLMKEKLADYGNVQLMEDYALLALQGPKAREVLSLFNTQATDMKFMDVKSLDLLGYNCLVSCSGYTGEDGYEIAIPEEGILTFVQKVLENQDVALVGLGARDTLRLEAGLCLYGQDIDEDTTPVEAGIEFAISEKRRQDASFCGADVILGQLKSGTDVKIAAVLSQGKMPMRANCRVISSEGEDIGYVTSGSYSPSLDSSIALVKIDAAYAKEKVKVWVEVRGKRHQVEVVALPFVAHRYVK